MTEERSRYAELMAPAFVEALEGVAPAPSELSAPIMGWVSCQTAVKEALGKINWDGTGLGPRPFTKEDGETIELPSNQYADRLMSFAFDDAFRLISMCEETANTMILPAGISLGQLLVNGRHSLLTISRVSDKRKGQLFSAIALAEMSDMADMNFRPADAPDVTDPIVFIDDKEQPRLVWSKTIEDWLTERRNPDEGCPAHAVKVKVDDKKISAVYFFWDKLVRAMYEM